MPETTTAVVMKTENKNFTDVCSSLPDSLRNENGSGFGFVCIWRIDDEGEDARTCTVEEWLSKPENFGGEWLIDGGWGGPPGPIKVRWDGEKWQNLGFPPWQI